MQRCSWYSRPSSDHRIITGRLASWDFLFVAKNDLPYRTCAESLLVVVLLGVDVERSVGSRTVKWTSMWPLSSQKLTIRDQDIPIERRLSASTVSLNVFELLDNQRAGGIGRNPRTHCHWHFPARGPHTTSADYGKALLEFTVFDASQCIIQRACPAVNSPGGGCIFMFDNMLASGYHVSALVRQIISCQPLPYGPRLFHLDSVQLAPTLLTHFLSLLVPAPASAVSATGHRSPILACGAWDSAQLGGFFRSLRSRLQVKRSWMIEDG